MIRALLTIWLMVATMALAQPGATQEARIDVADSSLTLGAPQGWFGKNRPRPMTLRLALDQPVPYRVFLLDGPPRLVVDLKGGVFADATPDQMPGAEALPALRWGAFQRGWSRLVAELPGPFRIARAYQDSAAAIIEITLEPVAAEDFHPRPDTALRGLPDPAPQPAPATSAPQKNGTLFVMLDPGHGGIDPGAMAGGLGEAELVLSFAHELAAALRIRGLRVGMTRQDDSFLGLEARMTAARTAGADLFLSLHADALPQGQAAGATVYVWDSAAGDLATRQLAARHDRDDLLAGLDLGGTDDQLTATLLDLARADTQPRAQDFAKFLASGMVLGRIALHRRPVKGARFAVLKSPDIPSVLLELGFITDPTDRANLTDPEWRARMVGVIAEAVTRWAEDDAARTPLLRR